MRALRARYPLELVSAKNDDSMNSTFGNRDAVDAQTAKLILHPLDAAARGLQSGDAVKVYNDRGSCLMTASVEDGVRPRRGARSLCKMEQAVPRWLWHKCIDFRPPCRHRRRTDFL